MASWFDHIPSLTDDPTHPTQIVLRTYALALSLSLGPSLIPFITSVFAGRKSSRVNISALKRILERELGHDGFAFAITLSVGGGAALRHLWNNSDNHSLSHTTEEPRQVLTTKEMSGDHTGVKARSTVLRAKEHILHVMKERLRRIVVTSEQRSFIANVIASSVGIFFLQRGRERISRAKKGASLAPVSPTMDLTLLLVVRAMDSMVQSLIHARSGRKEHHRPQKHRQIAEPKLMWELLEKERRARKNVFKEKFTMKVDGLLFWACSARIMWCFFYEPHRLPRSYVKWINSLASVDSRLLEALNFLREGKWTYGDCNPLYVDLLKSYASDLGRPSSWADPSVLPPYGGPSANKLWKSLGVASRPGVGGLPCEVVHGEVGKSLGLSHSCLANTGLRGCKAFMKAIAIYLPAHFLPVLMTHPKILSRPHRFLQTLFGAFRSAIFLSTFVASYWFAVCVTRSLVLAKYLPFISHNFWDGPYGCMLAGSLVCGSSIWIENGKRRGEMALYVMPKAMRTCLPDSWTKTGRHTRIVERIVMILSISTLLTAAVHRPESLRGLSRWTLSFIMYGPNAGFWKRRRGDPSIPPTPIIPPTSVNTSAYQTPPSDLSRSHTPKLGNHARNPSSLLSNHFSKM